MGRPFPDEDPTTNVPSIAYTFFGRTEHVHYKMQQTAATCVNSTKKMNQICGPQHDGFAPVKKRRRLYTAYRTIDNSEKMG